MEWNEETIEKLRALWAEGHSTAEIGRRMGVSKNAVVGQGASAEPAAATITHPPWWGAHARAGACRAG